jgi:hypothetical protein
MQLDELKARRCRKEKIIMVKSTKSRCCKNRCSKVKGFPAGGLFDIAVYTFSRPHRVAIYILRTTPTTSRSWYCLLVSKDKKLKIEKDSRRSQNFLKLTLTHRQSWIDPPPPCFSFWRISLISAFSLFISRYFG